MNILQHLLTACVRLYQVAISPLLASVFSPMGFGCRYQPTCSQYAIAAVREHGACRGSLLAGRRLCRCHPWADSGFDPVPPRQGARPTASSQSPLIFRRNGS